MTETDLGGLASADNTRINLPTGETAQIIADVATRYGYSYADMVGARGPKRMSACRTVAYAEVKKRRPHLSYPQIGRAFGGRDHSTVIDGVQRHQAKLLWAEFLIWAANGEHQPDLFQ